MGECPPSTSRPTSKMSSQAFDLGPANARISPFIKLSRWSLLFAGIYWGVHRRQVNLAKADEERAYKARMQPVWDAEAAMKKAKDNREGMLYLAKETGVPVPKDF